MSVRAKIEGYRHLPNPYVFSPVTISQAQEIVKLLEGRFGFTAYDTAPAGFESIKVWGTHSEGSRVEVTIFWDGFVDILKVGPDGSSGATGLEFTNALLYLYQISPHIPP